MATSDNRIPANKVALLFVVLLAIWAGWLFVPRAEKPHVTLPPTIVESKLRAVGLKDNPDWDGLPDFFAIQAARADWVNDRALFAYWCSGTKDYSYFFAAIRENGKIRFQEIPKPEGYDPEYYEGDSESTDFPIRLIGRIHTAIPVDLLDAPTILDSSRAKATQPIVPIDLTTNPIKPDASSSRANEDLKGRPGK